MKTGLVILIAAGWIGCGPFLAWFMWKRGYEAFSWLLVGSMIGPAALAIAVMERRRWMPPLPEVVVPGIDHGGAVNIMLSMDPGLDVVRVARPLIERMAGHIGWLSIVRVLPKGGPRAELVRARRAIASQLAAANQGAEGVLLFGRTDTALLTKAREEGFHVVVTATPDQSVSQALARSTIRYVGGSDAVRGKTSAWTTAPSHEPSPFLLTRLKRAPCRGRS